MELNRFNLEEIKQMKGQKIKGFHEIAMQPDGSMIKIPFYCVVGEEEGPVLLLEGGIHGDEVEGAEQIALVAKELDPKTLKGVYVGIPHMNLQAFNIGRRADMSIDYTVPDLNRNFPGNYKNGKIGVYTLAHYVEHFVKKADYMVSFHSGGNTLHLEPIAYYIDPAIDAKQGEVTLKMAKAFGTRFVGRGGFNPAFGASTLKGVTIPGGIPVMTVEIGGNSSIHGMREEWARLFHNGIYNTLKVLGMMDGEPEPQRPDQVFCVQEFLHGTHGGVFHPVVKPFDLLKKGDLMAYTLDIFGETVEEHFAPYDGIVTGYWTGCVIQPREWTILYAKVIPNE